MGAGQATADAIVRVLKRDQLGRVELVLDGGGDGGGGGARVRRVACGSRLPLSRAVARLLLARERTALAALAGLEGVPRLADASAADRGPGADARAGAGPAGAEPAGAERGVLEREWLAGAPLSRATALPADWFDHLEALVRALHARGVCHNDLHKEQNVLVRPDGRPALIDFQLASVHRRRGRGFATRAREDLRHVQKHRRRYTRDGRGPDGVAQVVEGERMRRSLLALVWRRTAKPVYVAVTRGLLRTRDGEERRPSSGPWPAWTAPLGPVRTD